MANKIQIKRGLYTNLPTLDSGEFGFCTDTKQTFIGDGSTNYELVSTKLFEANSFLYATTSGTPDSKSSAEVLSILSGSASSTFDLNNNILTGLATPVSSSDGVNKNYVDSLITTGVACKEALLDKDLTEAPTSPTEGDRYWVSSTASGTWVGQDYNIAEWNGSSWEYTSTIEGDYAYVDDENLFYFRTASGIAKFASGMGSHADSHIDGTDDIQDATAIQKGLMTASYASKLDGISTGAEVNPDVVPQVEAETGTATTERIWTAERVKQAIVALSPAGVTSFTGLTDSPANYTGSASNIVRVNSGANALEFVTFADTYLETTPTNGELNKAPNSDWAYDHDVATTGVHGAGVNTLLHSASTVDGGTFT